MWYYNYTMKPTDDEIAFLNENSIEFIPMTIHEKMWSPNCTFAQEDSTKWDYCGVEKMVNYLQDAQDKLDVPMTKLLGFNEAWDERSKSKWIEPAN
jgi:hypothetical protein